MAYVCTSTYSHIFLICFLFSQSCAKFRLSDSWASFYFQFEIINMNSITNNKIMLMLLTYIFERKKIHPSFKIMRNGISCPKRITWGVKKRSGFFLELYINFRYGKKNAICHSGLKSEKIELIPMFSSKAKKKFFEFFFSNKATLQEEIVGWKKIKKTL